MRIADARAGDLAGLGSLMTASPLLRRYGVTARGARASLREALRERDVLLVARDGERVVGLAWLIAGRALDRSAYLRLLLVDERVRSRGLGGSLLQRAERRARAARCRHLALLVTRTNRRARAFYARHGYRHVGDLPGFVRRGLDEALYLKRLTPPDREGAGGGGRSRAGTRRRPRRAAAR
jgi:GNAT superfamily N-acetyltransferase